MADVYEELTGRIPVRNIGDQWLLFAEGFYLLRKEYVQKLKRLLDFVASGTHFVPDIADHRSDSPCHTD